jgi:hypothetical protein
VHSDYRRDWLRLPSAAAGAAARSRRRKSIDTSSSRLSVGGGGGEGGEGCWDTLDDGYFNDAERAELREQAVQARSSVPASCFRHTLMHLHLHIIYMHLHIPFSVSCVCLCVNIYIDTIAAV